MKFLHKYFSVVMLSTLLPLHVDAQLSQEIVEYCEPRLYPRPGFYMVNSDGERYIPQKVYMSQLLSLNKTSEPDYKAWAENPPTDEGFGRIMQYVMALLDGNDACDCRGTMYLAKLFHYYQPGSEHYNALPEENKVFLQALVFAEKQIISNALKEAKNMNNGMETSCP